MPDRYRKFLQLHNKNFAEPHNLKIYSEIGQVSMTSTSLTSSIESWMLADLSLTEHDYPNLRLSVRNELCADVLIGHDVMKFYSRIDMAFGGKHDHLQICIAAPSRVHTLIRYLVDPDNIQSKTLSSSNLKFRNNCEKE